MRHRCRRLGDVLALLIMRASFILRNVPSSASAELAAATNGRIVHKLWNNAPFSLTGSSSLGIEPKNKYPDALLAALRHR